MRNPAVMMISGGLMMMHYCQRGGVKQSPETVDEALGGPHGEKWEATMESEYSIFMSTRGGD